MSVNSHSQNCKWIIIARGVERSVNLLANTKTPFHALFRANSTHSRFDVVDVVRLTRRRIWSDSARERDGDTMKALNSKSSNALKQAINMRLGSYLDFWCVVHSIRSTVSICFNYKLKSGGEGGKQGGEREKSYRSSVVVCRLSNGIEIIFSFFLLSLAEQHSCSLCGLYKNCWRDWKRFIKAWSSLRVSFFCC